MAVPFYSLVLRPSRLLSPVVLSSVSTLQHQLSTSLAAFSLNSNTNRIFWVPPSQLRFQLFSPGQLDGRRRAQLERLLTDGRLPPRFDVPLCALGATPSWRKPREIWIAPRTTGQKKPLKQLYALLRSLLQPLYAPIGRRASSDSRVFSPTEPLHDSGNPYEPTMTIGVFQELYTPSLKRMGPEVRKMPLQEYPVDFILRAEAIDVVEVEWTHSGRATERLVFSVGLPEQE